MSLGITEHCEHFIKGQLSSGTVNWFCRNRNKLYSTAKYFSFQASSVCGSCSGWSAGLPPTSTQRSPCWASFWMRSASCGSWWPEWRSGFRNSWFRPCSSPRRRTGLGGRNSSLRWAAFFCGGGLFVASVILRRNASLRCNVLRKL